MAVDIKDRNIKYVVKHVTVEGDKFLSRFNEKEETYTNTELLRMAYHFCSYDKADHIMRLLGLDGEVCPVVINYTLQI